MYGIRSDKTKFREVSSVKRGGQLQRFLLKLKKKAVFNKKFNLLAQLQLGYTSYHKFTN